MKARPDEITKFSETALMIVWDDGHESIYLFQDLRESCPCATCRQLRKKSEKSFKKRIPIGTKSKQIKPLRIEPVGSYAIRFRWNDKHDTGLYSFDFLRELCTCEECQNEE